MPIHLSYDRAALESAALRAARKAFAMDLDWGWPSGVAFYGVTRAWEALGGAGDSAAGASDGFLRDLGAWVDEYLGYGLPPHTVNTSAMGHPVLTLYLRGGEARYKEVLDGIVDYLEARAPRFGESVLQHTVSERDDFPGQCWADTLFMAAYFLLRAGVALGEPALVADALNQFQWHIRYLHDPETGLWFHGYDSGTGGHMSGFHWARANAWAAYTMSRVGRVLPEPYLYPAYMDVGCSLRDLLAAARRLQAGDGLWRTLLDDPGSYGETSATAGLGAAMLMNGNPLHTANAQRALDAVLARVAPDGAVQGVSGGTAVMRDREGYRAIPNTWAQGWGQGLALAFFAAALEQGGA
jgi:unsaturated rhamnogalacturonyl hydrolase